MLPAGVTNLGASCPVTVRVNVRSAIRSTKVTPLTTFSVYALTANLLVTFLATSVGTPCKLAIACGMPMIKPVLVHWIPAGSSPAIIV